MEEILASIRRIISDDEAKPAAAAAAAPVAAAPVAAPSPKTEVPKAEMSRPAPARPVMSGIPPSKIAPVKPAAAAAPAPAPAPAKNSQAEIDAMMASFDAPAAPPPKAEVLEEDNDVFELTEQMAVPEVVPPSFNKIEPEDDLEFTESPMVQASHHRSPAMESPSFTERAPPREMPTQQIMSGPTVSAVESAFNALQNTVLSNNARTLEDLVKEMLRPMLKSWLDDNLPNLVERIVKAEIERVSRGR
jgi:cell pole-organizing protein PopZ